jgi:hypothetical protein
LLPLRTTTRRSRRDLPTATGPGPYVPLEAARLGGINPVWVIIEMVPGIETGSYVTPVFHAQPALEDIEGLVGDIVDPDRTDTGVSEGLGEAWCLDGVKETQNGKGLGFVAVSDFDLDGLLTLGSSSVCIRVAVELKGLQFSVSVGLGWSVDGHFRDCR